MEYASMQPGYIGPHNPVVAVGNFHRGSGGDCSIPPQPVSHDLEVLEKSVESLRDSLRELNVQLDPVMNPEGPHGEGLAAMRASLSVCPLAERIRRITESVQDVAASVASTRRRLAL